MINIFSITAIPLIISIILVHGLAKRVNIYDAFIEGASEGFKTATRIMPYLIAIFIAIGFMRKSNAMDLIIKLAAPISTKLGIPSEILPLAIMRPISGSGSLAILQDIINTYGVDSMIAKIAATMMGSAETIFYTMAVYFGAVGVKKARHTVPIALLAHFAAVIASVVICSIVFS